LFDDSERPTPGRPAAGAPSRRVSGRVARLWSQPSAVPHRPRGVPAAVLCLSWAAPSRPPGILGPGPRSRSAPRRQARCDRSPPAGGASFLIQRARRAARPRSPLRLPAIRVPVSRGEQGEGRENADLRSLPRSGMARRGAPDSPPQAETVEVECPSAPPWSASGARRRTCPGRPVRRLRLHDRGGRGAGHPEVVDPVAGS
jgi:hypothetical protein